LHFEVETASNTDSILVSKKDNPRAEEANPRALQERLHEWQKAEQERS